MPEQHTTEIWRPIPLTDGWYEASNLGRIRRIELEVFGGGVLLETKPATLLARRRSLKGYDSVMVRTEHRKQMTCYIHKLVADAFIGARPSGLDINHKDGNRENNRPENLEYVTRSRNIQHSYHELGRQPYTLPNRERCDGGTFKSKVSDDEIHQIIRRYKAGGVTQRTLATEYGVSIPYVCMIVNNQRRRKSSAIK